MNMKKDNHSSQFNPITQIVFVLIAGLLLASLAGVGYVYAFESKHAETIYPGVSVSGVDVSGLTLGEAVLKLNESLTYPQMVSYYLPMVTNVGYILLSS